MNKIKIIGNIWEYKSKRTPKYLYYVCSIKSIDPKLKCILMYSKATKRFLVPSCKITDNSLREKYICTDKKVPKDMETFIYNVIDNNGYKIKSVYKNFTNVIEFVEKDWYK